MTKPLDLEQFDGHTKGRWEVGENAALLAEVKALREALSGLCYHWDELLNNIDCGEEYEARKLAGQALK